MTLHNCPRVIRQHHRLPLALVNPKVRVQKATRIEVSSLRLTTAHHHDEAVRGDNRTCWNLKFCWVVNVVGEIPTADVDRIGSLVEQLYEVFIVSCDVQRIVRTREFVDYDLRVCAGGQQAKKGQKRIQVTAQIQGSAMYGGITPNTPKGCTEESVYSNREPKWHSKSSKPRLTP